MGQTTYARIRSGRKPNRNWVDEKTTGGTLASGREGGPAVGTRPATVRRRAACPDHGRRGLRRPPPPGCAHGTRMRGDRVVGRRPRRRPRSRTRYARRGPDAVAHLAAVASVAEALDRRARGLGRERRRHPQRRAGGRRAAPARAPAGRVVGRGLRRDRRGRGSRSARTRRSLPRSPYGRSKAAAEIACARRRSTSWSCARSRTSGRARTRRFAIASFAAQIARIERGVAPPADHGRQPRRATRLLRRARRGRRLRCGCSSGAAARAASSTSATARRTAAGVVLDRLLALATPAIGGRDRSGAPAAADIPLLRRRSARGCTTATGWRPTRSLDENSRGRARRRATRSS